MRTNFVLIDFENVQPKDLGLLKDGPFKVKAYFKPALPAASDAQVELVVADLIRRKASKPRTQKTLLSTLHALFKKELSEQQLAHLFDALCRRGVVRMEGTKVSYELPDER
jgi:hypothetical protein